MVTRVRARSACTTLTSLAIVLLVTTGCREDECGEAPSCVGPPVSGSNGSPESETLTSSAATSRPGSTTTPPTNTSAPQTTAPQTTALQTDAPQTDPPQTPAPQTDAPTDTGSVSWGDPSSVPDRPGSSDEVDTSGETIPRASDGTSAAEDSDAPNATDGESTATPTEEAPGNDSTQEPDDTNTTDEVPATSHCAPAADWDPAWSQWEEEVLLLVNTVRATGANCDTKGAFGSTTPLTMDPMLRCSARLHSEDMFIRDYFAHDNPDGLDPFERMADAGFEGGWMGENIAAGQTSPEEVMQAWVDSDGHCANIMNPNFTSLGVGYYPGGATWQEGQHFWTQNFGTPLR